MDSVQIDSVKNNPKDFNLDVHVAYTINSDTRTCSITSIGGHERPTAAYLRTALSVDINRFKLYDVYGHTVLSRHIRRETKGKMVARIQKYLLEKSSPVATLSRWSVPW
jgi:hypothetical protein